MFNNMEIKDQILFDYNKIINFLKVHHVDDLAMMGVVLKLPKNDLAAFAAWRDQENKKNYKFSFF